MNEPPIPLGALQTRLREVTETLITDLALPSSTTPGWSESQWRLARAAAAIHGISPLLARASRWQGPSGWHQFINEQRSHTEQRHVRIRDLLGRLDEAARTAGIALLALKGAALHELEIYRPGERPMADVDLLVQADIAARAARMLEQLGFHLSHTNWKHQVFVTELRPKNVLGENAANGMKIELHQRIAEALPRRAVDISVCLSSNSATPGLNYYPSRAALMLHLLLHAAGSMVFRALRCINLIDIARLSASMSARDWDELLALESRLDEPIWWAYPPLATTARYYPAVIPKDVLSATSHRCQWLLKRTTRRRSACDSSLCYLPITAFPGIEWARSPREMLEYVYNRLIPDAQIRSLRESQATTEPAAANSTWSYTSQTRRIARWLISRPARAESLFPIQVALGQLPAHPPLD